MFSWINQDMDFNSSWIILPSYNSIEILFPYFYNHKIIKIPTPPRTSVGRRHHANHWSQSLVAAMITNHRRCRWEIFSKNAKLSSHPNYRKWNLIQWLVLLWGDFFFYGTRTRPKNVKYSSYEYSILGPTTFAGPTAWNLFHAVQDCK